MTEIAQIKTRPQADRHAGPEQAPRGPACVRVRGVRCLCSECGAYVTVAHIVRGRHRAFCGRCCPICNSRPPLSGGQHAA